MVILLAEAGFLKTVLYFTKSFEYFHLYKEKKKTERWTNSFKFLANSEEAKGFKNWRLSLDS